eukprot:TRINITY_DN3412_c1_g1_i3.p2 TRINITY_DN3412_c1_g1~~TRINITY_DN3412_c1_g1_i3.p2  ORF type:complete len:215 (-),score=15.07 TRINITY_DN3412_c1_g1_i3:359-1003(-)
MPGIQVNDARSSDSNKHLQKTSKYQAQKDSIAHTQHYLKIQKFKNVKQQTDNKPQNGTRVVLFDNNYVRQDNFQREGMSRNTFVGKKDARHDFDTSNFGRIRRSKIYQQKLSKGVGICQDQLQLKDESNSSQQNEKKKDLLGLKNDFVLSDNRQNLHEMIQDEIQCHSSIQGQEVQSVERQQEHPLVTQNGTILVSRETRKVGLGGHLIRLIKR